MDAQQYTALGTGLALTAGGVFGYLDGTTLLLFTVNKLHNHIHLVSGIIGILAALFFHGIHARLYNKAFGVVYLAVGVIGIVLPRITAELLNANFYDHLLHLGIAAILLYAGYKITPEPSVARA